jgi:hypothetical protein
MRIRIMAVSGALAASTLLTVPAVATETTSPTTEPVPVTTTAPVPTQAKLRFRNSCRPKKAALPQSVQGRPLGFAPGAAKGVYIWHEKAGWRIRVTHPRTLTGGKPDLIEVRGRITSTRKFAKVRSVQLEDKQRGEWVSVRNPNRKVMEFRFVNGGFIDGINFTAGCSGRLGFTVWQVVKDPTGAVVGRSPMPVYVGPEMMRVDATTTPSLAPGAPTDVSRVVILRAPVTKKT